MSTVAALVVAHAANRDGAAFPAQTAGLAALVFGGHDAGARRTELLGQTIRLGTSAHD